MTQEQIMSALSLLGKAVPPVMRPWDAWAWGSGRSGNSDGEMDALQAAHKAARLAPAAPKGDRLPMAPTSLPMAPQVPAAPASAVPGGAPGLAADMGWQNLDHRSANMPGMEHGLLNLGAQRVGTPQPAPAPVVAQGAPVGASVPMSQPRPQMPAPAPAPSPVPTPQPRPAEAPQADPMSFWQRNAAMMRDPTSGDFLDPAAAKRADATGPDLVQKFMNYFHDKA